MVKKIFIFVIIGLLAAIGVIAYLKISEQMRILNREAAKISTMDRENGMVDMNLYCTGDYMAVEDTIKSYVNDYLTEKKAFENSLLDEKIYSMLGISNLQSDGPEFMESIDYLEQKRADIEEEADRLVSFGDEKNMRAAIETASAGEFQQKLYEKEMMETIGTGFFATAAELKKVKDDMLTSIDEIEDVLYFLKDNAGRWSVEYNVLKFENDQLLNEYQTLTSKIV